MSINTNIFLPTFSQAIALLTPFVFMKIVFDNHGSEVTILSEVILSITAFFSIIIDWSSTTFLARVQGRLLASGAYFSILLGKLVIALILLFFVYLAFSLIYLEKHEDSDMILYLFAILIGIVFDPSWMYIGRKKIWALQGISALRFSLAIIFTMAGLDPILSLSISYVFSSILFTIPLYKIIYLPKRISFRLIIMIIKRYSLVTFTDVLTAMFSRLDVPTAALLLSVDSALIYTVCRKLILGFQSITFASSRLLYIERDPHSHLYVRKSLFYISIATLIIGNLVSYIVAVKYFYIKDTSALLFTLLSLSCLIPLGFLKVNIQFSYLFRKNKLKEHFYMSFFSGFMFYFLCGVLYFIHVDSAIFFAFIRLSSDITYIYLSTMKYGINEVFN